MKTLLNTFLLLVVMLAAIAAHKAWRDYKKNEQIYQRETALSLWRVGKLSREELYERTYP